MIDTATLLAILLMAGTTYLTHIGGYLAFRNLSLSPRAVTVMEAAPITESAQAFVEDRTLDGIRDARQAFAQAGQLERLQKYHGDKAAWVLGAWVDTWLAGDFRHWNLDNVLPLVHCPVLAMHGDRDEYGSVRHPERIAALAAGPVVTGILADCGHVPHREKLGAVINAVVAFLA